MIAFFKIICIANCVKLLHNFIIYIDELNKVFNVSSCCLLPNHTNDEVVTHFLTYMSDFRFKIFKSPRCFSVLF